MNEIEDRTLWHHIAATYDLGDWTAAPSAVTGGLRHRLYRARTGRGEYAVKVLSPQLLREPGHLARYGRAEQIAQAAARAGLPAVCALSGPDGPVQPVGAAAVMVFPWLPGAALPPAPAAPEAARQIGALLGRLHALAPDVPGLEPPAVPYFPSDHWAGLARLGAEDGSPWAASVKKALSGLGEWSAAASRAREALGNAWTATHRDMDQKNVLWSGPDTPHLLDWEEAGAMNPALELMGAALNWAGQAAGPPDVAVFAAFLGGYRNAAPLDPAALRCAAVAVLDKWLVWLDFNLQRSLAPETPPDERETADGAAMHALLTLHTLAADTPRRLLWCETVTAAPPAHPTQGRDSSRPLLPSSPSFS